MSLIAAAMRIAAVRALIGGTTLIPSGRIFDSTLTALDKLATGDDPEPFLSVATEDESDTPNGRDLQTGNRTILLVIETGLATVVSLPGEGGEEVAIQSTDANAELALAVLDRQIRACLWGRGGGAWGDAFRALAPTVKEFDVRRGIPAQSGQRFAARQAIYLIQPVAEPPFDAALDPKHPLAKFFVAANADPAVAAQAEILRRAIEGKPIDWPDVYTRSGVAAGMTEEEGDRIGILSHADEVIQIDVGTLEVTPEPEE